jgi:hypothetical protein
MGQSQTHDLLVAQQIYPFMELQGTLTCLEQPVTRSYTQLLEYRQLSNLTSLSIRLLMRGYLVLLW